MRAAELEMPALAITDRGGVYSAVRHLQATGYELRRSMSASQARWELENSRRKLLDAIAAAPREALDPSRYGAAGLLSEHEDHHLGWIQRWRGEKGF